MGILWDRRAEFVPRREGGRFFTLIELLIVIAIIAIIASMLLPALNKARARAQGTKCSGNVKTLSQSVIFYADAYGDYLPGPYTYYHSTSANGSYWQTQFVRCGVVAYPLPNDTWGRPEGVWQWPAENQIASPGGNFMNNWRESHYGLNRLSQYAVCLNYSSLRMSMRN